MNIYVNPQAADWASEYTLDPAVLRFHQGLDSYNRTPLRYLPGSFTEKHNLPFTFIKDESHRFGLPSYKILGASWGCYRAMIKEHHVPSYTPMTTINDLAGRELQRIYTATDGNWGRAVARMACLMGCYVSIYVPKVMAESTRAKIRQEGPLHVEVVVVDGDYDRAVKEAEKEAKKTKSLLIEDTAWEGYEEIPQVSERARSSSKAKFGSGSLKGTRP